MPADYNLNLSDIRVALGLSKTTHDILNAFILKHPEFEETFAPEHQFEHINERVNQFILRSIDLWEEGFVERFQQILKEESDLSHKSIFICQFNGGPTTLLYCINGHFSYCVKEMPHFQHSRCSICDSDNLHWTGRNLNICGITLDHKRLCNLDLKHGDKVKHKFIDGLILYPVLVWS